jgi:hypothetical protein
MFADVKRSITYLTEQQDIYMYSEKLQQSASQMQVE